MDDFHVSDQQQTDLDGVLKDVNQKYTLRRYQMIGEAMRNELPDRIPVDFASDVMARISEEPSLNVDVNKSAKVETKQTSFWSGLFRPMAGLAIAASVAFVAVTSIQLQQPVADGQPDVIANVDSSASAQKVEQLARIPVINNAVNVSTNPSSSNSNGMNWKIKRSEPEMQSKLNTYLVNHNEYSSSMHGIIPQVRVVGFDVQK